MPLGWKGMWSGAYKLVCLLPELCITLPPYTPEHNQPPASG